MQMYAEHFPPWKVEILKSMQNMFIHAEGLMTP